MNVDYSRIVFMVYDGLLHDLLELPVQKACETIKSIKYKGTEPKGELEKIGSLFDLFLNLSQFVKKGLHIWSTNEPIFKLKNFQLWFSDCVVHWLHMSTSKASAR
jgi:hypothetical protein